MSESRQIGAGLEACRCESVDGHYWLILPAADVACATVDPSGGGGAWQARIDYTIPLSGAQLSALGAFVSGLAEEGDE
jgi:hypothetical protein